MSSFDISKYTGAAVLLSLQKFCKTHRRGFFVRKLFSIIAYNERHLSRENISIPLREINVRVCIGKVCRKAMSLPSNLRHSNLLIVDIYI